MAVDATALSSVEAPTSSSGGCARRSRCWGRCSPAPARPAWRCPAATTSARGRSTSTSRACKMGAEIDSEHGFLVASARGSTAASITLDYPSVGATENLMMAAVLADGISVIDNAAREPEIADLAAFLDAMGAGIHGAGSATIEIEGVEALLPAEHTAIPTGSRRGRGRRRPSRRAATSCCAARDRITWSCSWRSSARAGAEIRMTDDGCASGRRTARGRRTSTLRTRGSRPTSSRSSSRCSRRPRGRASRPRTCSRPVHLRGRAPAHGRGHPHGGSPRGDPRGRAPGCPPRLCARSTSARGPRWRSPPSPPTA